MIERFNGRSAEVLATTRFDSAEHLADTIKRYVKGTLKNSRCPVGSYQVDADAGRAAACQHSPAAESGPCGPR